MRAWNAIRTTLLCLVAAGSLLGCATQGGGKQSALALESRSIVAVTDDRDAADAVVVAGATMGVGPANGVFFGDYGLNVAADYAVVDRNGTVLFKRATMTVGSREIEGATLEQFLGDPAVVRDRAQTAANVSARILASYLMVARRK